MNSLYDPHSIASPEELCGLSTREEALALFELAKKARGSIIELGVYCGYTSLFLAYGIRNRSPELQKDVQLYTVDRHVQVSPLHADQADMIEKNTRYQLCTFHRFVANCKRYRVWDLIFPVIDDIAEAAKHWTYGKCGLLFIDGDHDNALRDFRLYSPFVETGGIVCFHDYSPEFPKVMADVDLLIAEGSIVPLLQEGRLFAATLV